MNKFILVLTVFLGGCASFTIESVVKDHKIKRVEVISGTANENFVFAKKLLPTCYQTLDFAGIVKAKEFESNGVKSLLLGNEQKGGTNLFEFSLLSDGNTELRAYDASWYDIDTELFNKYVDGIVRKDMNVCT